MTDSSIARITGKFGVACVLLSWAQFPLWVIGGAPPFYDREAFDPVADIVPCGPMRPQTGQA